jgi:hypothetical protein
VADFNRIVGEIRILVESADRTDQPQAAALAKEYAAVCAEANGRLNRCFSFLRRGLRSEALHLAKAEPDLLDMVGVLDFPERDEWDQLTIANGWTRAPSLAIESAHALNEAYAQEYPLEGLLRTHRLLALARSAVAPRLETMRKIAWLDSNNPIWGEDIRRFEKVRQEELGQAIPIAYANRNAAALQAILREVESSEWLAAPPQSLVTLARTSALQVRQEEIRKKLQDLLGSLHKARVTHDTMLGQKLWEQWQSLIAGAKLPPDDPLRGLAQPARDWLDREDRREASETAYREALSNLEQALERKEMQPTLAELEQAVLGFGRGLPQVVQARLKERYRAFERLTRLRARLILAGVGAATMALIGLVAWSNARLARSRETQQASAKIESMLEAGKMEEAREVLDHLESDYPGASQLDEIAGVVDRLETLERAERDRAAQFLAAMTEVRATPLTQEGVPALETARRLARLPYEKSQVEQLASQRQAVLERERDRVDRKLRPWVEAFRDRIGKAESLVKQSPESKQTEEVLASLRSEIPALRDEAAHAGMEVRKEAMACLTRYEAMSASRATSLEQNRMLESMINAAGSIVQGDDVKSFLDVCARYTGKFPDDARAESLRKLVNEQILWQSVVAWSAMVRSWPSPVTSIAPKDAKDRLEQLTQFRVANPRLATPEILEKYQKYVEATARLGLLGGDDPPAQLRRLFSKPLVNKVWMLNTRNGKVYYTLKEPQRAGSGYRIDSLVTIDCSERPVFIPKSNFLKLGLAPQSEIATEVKNSLLRAADSQTLWDAVMVKILTSVRNEPELDPVLKVILLKGAIQAASEGSASLAEALSDHLRMIEDAQLNLNVTWVDPDDAKAELERHRAQDVLARLPSFEPCAEKAKMLRQLLEDQIAQVYWPVGLLLKGGDGIWRCRSPQPIPPETELFALAPQGSWKRIGKATGNNGELAPEPGVPDLIEGRLVFIHRRAG